LPPDNKLVGEHALIVEHTEECRYVLLLSGVANKVHADYLHEALDAKVTILSHQVEEGGLVLGPMLNTVSLALERTKEE
jgi:hypothetical protein